MSIIFQSVYRYGILNGLHRVHLKMIGVKKLSRYQFDNLADETLESLHEYFDDILISCHHLPNSDVLYQNGVLTVFLDPTFGTYVINKQTPNTQIWLSSPRSGPRRYDFIENIDSWIYRHDNRSLHEQLQLEFSQIIGEVNFFECKHSGNRKVDSEKPCKNQHQ